MWCESLVWVIMGGGGGGSQNAGVLVVLVGPDNGLSPGRRQAIIWTNVGILLIGPWGTNFSEILIDIQTLSFKKMHLKMSSAKWRPFCFGLDVLKFNYVSKRGPDFNESKRPSCFLFHSQSWASADTWKASPCDFGGPTSEWFKWGLKWDQMISKCLIETKSRRVHHDISANHFKVGVMEMVLFPQTTISN